MHLRFIPRSVSQMKRTPLLRRRFPFQHWSAAVQTVYAVTHVAALWTYRFGDKRVITGQIPSRPITCAPVVMSGKVINNASSCSFLNTSLMHYYACGTIHHVSTLWVWWRCKLFPPVYVMCFFSRIKEKCVRACVCVLGWLRPSQQESNACAYVLTHSYLPLQRKYRNEFRVRDL